MEEMSYYAEYLNQDLDISSLTVKRKALLKRIAEIRGRPNLVIASDLLKSDARISIDYSDIISIQDQLSNLQGKSIDIILETPGGIAEVVEDMVRLIRQKFERVAIIVPGWAKSAGTIFAMAGDEILMGPTSALGPIDAQIVTNNKRFSADAFLEGLNKIKNETEKSGRLNIAYIPILQGISPGEIQHCENAQNFSKILVTQWLRDYKFKFWEKHSDGKDVTLEDREKRASEIAEELRSQSKWLTHGRSINIADLEKMRVKVSDFSKDDILNDAIMRYYTLLRMSFEGSMMYKLFETYTSQIYRFTAGNFGNPKDSDRAILTVPCPKCNTQFKIQANLQKNIPMEPDAIPFPVSDNLFTCSNCGNQINLSKQRLMIESSSGKKVVG